MGVYHKELESALREYLEAPYLSLIVNGHMALEMAIQAMKFPKGSEVITTPFTFISTTHAIVRNGLKPVFCDIKLEDYTIDEAKIEALITDKTVAVVPVHVYGNICNVETIEKVAGEHNLKVIYDAAHAFGVKYKGTGIGNYGDASVFSFHATKVYHTIEGGAVAFHDEHLYKRLYNLKNFGIQGEELVVDVGANAKMNEFAAIMGLCNLPNVETNIEKRRIRCCWYLEQLRDCSGICLPSYTRKDVSFNYAYFPVRFLEEGMRDWVYEELRKEGIYVRKYFYPLTLDALCYKKQFTDNLLENARIVSDHILVLPLYPELKRDEVELIVEKLKRAMGRSS